MRVSGERTVPGLVDEIDPPAAAVDAAPPRRSLARLPPLADPLARVVAPASIERAAGDRVEDGDPSTAPRGRLGRLPPFREPAPRVSAPETPSQVSGEAPVTDRVEEIELEEIALPPPPPARPTAPGATPSRPPRSDATRPRVPSGAMPADTVSANTVSANTVPADAKPADTVSANTVPADPKPADTVPANTVPANTVPADTGPGAEAMPALAMPALAMPALAEVERPSAATIVEDAAEYHCKSCQRRVPRAEIQVLTRDGRKTFAVCPFCNQYLGVGAPRAEAAPVLDRARRAERPQPRAHAQHSLQWLLVDAVGWPLTRHALPTLLGLTLVFWLLSSTWVLGRSSVDLAGLVMSFLVLTARAAAVIHATHRGEDAPPALLDEPSASLRQLCALLLGGAPLFAALVADRLGVRSPTDHTLLVVGGIAAFSVYVPASQIVVSKHETLAAALNPIGAMRFARRVGRTYLAPCMTLFVIAIAHLVAVAITKMVGIALFGGPTVAWGLLVSLVVVGGVMVEARVVGLVVRDHRFDLSLA
jgi:hypothetical protein